MGERYERKLLAHFIRTDFGGQSDTSWERIGEDLEEYSVEMNPIITVERNILDNDYVYHDGYEPTAAVSPYYARVGSALYNCLLGLIQGQDLPDGTFSGFAYGTFAMTEIIDAFLWSPYVSAENVYYAVRRPVCIGIDSYGGDYTAIQIPFTLTYRNTGQQRCLFDIEHRNIYTP